MSMSDRSTVDEVAEFYDDTAWTVEVVGGSIHVGYWSSDDDQTPLLAAINRFTDIVTDKLDLWPGQHLLDVGCGVGTPAIVVGQRTDARITGITNSEWHLREATRRANAAGLRGQVRIDYADAAALPYPDESFDAVLALESLVHARDRGQWLREMVRVLRPGGRAVITDIAEEIPLTEQDSEVMRAFTLAPPLAPPAFVDLVRDSGFTVEEFVSCGGRIRRSFLAYYERVEQRRAELVSVYGSEKIDKFLQEMPLVLDLLREKVGYVIVTGRKPA